MIPVTKPFLPPKDEYDDYLKGIWERNWLTNNGPLVNELELELKKYFGVNHLLYVANGTVALQLAIKALDLTGEIITTPFSYVATTSSIVWEGCKPVFVDIHPKTLNIDPSKIEEAISNRTSAILASHVYGNPCDIEAIQEIANKYQLKVIYDAAHCFGTVYKGKSILSYGDVSAISFHATKLYHTIEGGAVVTPDSELLRKMAFMRNFGHDGPEKFSELGINGKNSEFHAAMGLVNLKYVKSILERNKRLCVYYDNSLKGVDMIRPQVAGDINYNYAYYPIVLPNEQLLQKVVVELERNWIYPRRYFYPVLTSLPYIEGVALSIADDFSKRVLCLPLYYDLTKEEINIIAHVILRIRDS